MESTVKFWDVGEARVAWCDFARGLQRHRDQCPDHQYWLVLQGEWTVQGQRRTSLVRPTEATLDVPGHRCVRTVEQPLVALSVQVRGATHAHMSWEDEARLWRLAVLTRASDIDPWALETTLAGLGQASIRPEEGFPTWLCHARELLHESPRLTLQEVADQVGISPNHLCTQFRASFGVGIARYVRRLGVRRALAHLKRDDAWVQGGFYDPSHFRRAVKAELGVRPAEIRSLIA